MEVERSGEKSPAISMTPPDHSGSLVSDSSLYIHRRGRLRIHGYHMPNRIRNTLTKTRGRAFLVTNKWQTLQEVVGRESPV